MNAKRLALPLLLLSTGAFPLAADRDQPIQIQADRVVIDEAQRVSNYDGNVELTQGSLRVTATRVEVRHGEELDRIVADGTPVTLKQQSDQGQEIRGQADHVDYQAGNSLLELTGNAHLWQGKDEFSGPRIVYDAQRSVVRAEGQGNGRVSATIHPRQKNQKPESRK